MPSHRLCQLVARVELQHFFYRVKWQASSAKRQRGGAACLVGEALAAAIEQHAAGHTVILRYWYRHGRAIISFFHCRAITDDCCRVHLSSRRNDIFGLVVGAAAEEGLDVGEVDDVRYRP